jgi:predicted HicB family RNase H-like nuclease
VTESTKKGRPPKAEGTHYKTYNFTLPPNLMEAVRAKAEREELSLSEVLRRLLSQWVQEDGAEAR